MRKTKKGFTLVELLVTAAVVAVLSGLVALTIGEGPRKSGRDGQRKADLEKIRAALELYRNDKGGYPTTTNYTNSTTNCTTFPDRLVNCYLQVLPINPTPGGSTYTYTGTGTCGTYCTSYTLSTTLERPVGTYTVYP